LNFTDLRQVSFGTRIAYCLIEGEVDAEQFCHGALVKNMMSYRLPRSSVSRPYANTDKRFWVYEKTRVTRAVRIIFFLWLAISIALILTAISPRGAIIELLRRLHQPRHWQTLTFPTQLWNPWSYGAQSLVYEVPLPDARRETAC